MKRRIFLLAMILFTVVAIVPNAFSLSISTSGSGVLFGDTYSYLFKIDDQGDSTDGIFTATLTNTSSSSLCGALIDLLAFNLRDPDPTLPGNFLISNISPTWIFSQSSGGIQFDYTGNRTSPGTRLGPGDVLTFDMNFSDAYKDAGFGIFTNAETAAGTGIGGGEDFGQVAVHFQQLGRDGEESDLVASSGFTAPVPEPATILLIGMGIGIAGVAEYRRKRNKSS